MKKTTRRFPLVADDEPVSSPSKAMALYENSDLITNIHGAYREKDYNDVTNNYHFVTENDHDSERVKTLNEGKSYAELARDEARQDVKKKRQAYVSNNLAKLSKMANQQPLQTKKPNPPKKRAGKFSHLSANMRQDDYILAEIPLNHQRSQKESTQKAKKNSYEFLKHSQIYNKDANQKQKKYQKAQEMNLAQLDTNK